MNTASSLARHFSRTNQLFVASRRILAQAGHWWLVCGPLQQTPTDLVQCLGSCHTTVLDTKCVTSRTPMCCPAIFERSSLDNPFRTIRIGWSEKVENLPKCQFFYVKNESRIKNQRGIPLRGLLPKKGFLETGKREYN